MSDIDMVFLSVTDSGILQGRPQDFLLGARPKCRKSRPKAQSGRVVLGEGQQPALPCQLGVWGALSMVRGRAQTVQRLSSIFSTHDGLS